VTVSRISELHAFIDILTSTIDDDRIDFINLLGIDDPMKFDYAPHVLAEKYYEQIINAFKTNKEAISEYIKYTNIDDFITLADNYKDNIDAFNKEMDRISKEFNPRLQIAATTADAYSELTDAQRAFVTSYINTKSITVDDDNFAEMRDSIIDLVDDIGENTDLQNTINLGMRLKTGTDENGEYLSVSEYGHQFDQLMADIESYDGETQIVVNTALDTASMESQLLGIESSIKSLLIDEASAEEKLSDLGEKIRAEFSEGNVDLTDRIRVDNGDGTYSTVASSWFNDTIDGEEIAVHYTPILEGQYLSEETLSSYIGELLDGAVSASDILERDKTENGGLGIILRTKIGFDFDEENAWGDALHTIQEEYYNLQQEIKDGAYVGEIQSFIDNLTYAEALDIQYKISAEPNSLTLDELKKMIFEAGVDWSKTIDVLDFASMTDGLGNIEDAVSGLANAMAQLKNGTALTKEELAKLALQYPELLQVSDLFANTTVENQQSMLDAVLGSYESEYAALVDTKIAELTATNKLLEMQLDLEDQKRQKVVEIADMQSNGKLDSEKDYQELIQQLHDLEGKNYVMNMRSPTYPWCIFTMRAGTSVILCLLSN